MEYKGVNISIVIPEEVLRNIKDEVDKSDGLYTSVSHYLRVIAIKDFRNKNAR